MKKFLFALVVLFIAVVWILLANIPSRLIKPETNTTIRSASELNVGTVYFYPPFIYNESVGFDIALTTELCKQAGYHCHIVHESLAQLFTDLQAGKLDMAISALAITPERMRNFNFSVPYLTLNQTSFIGLKTVVPFTQLKKIKIGVVQDSLFERYLTKNPIAGASIVSYPYNNDLFAALTEQKIDLIFTDTPVAMYWVNKMNQEQNTKQLVLFNGPRGFPAQQLAIVIKKGDPLLLSHINQALATLIRQKSYEKMIKLYFNYADITIPLTGVVE